MRWLFVLALFAAAMAVIGCARKEGPVSARTTVVVGGITLGNEIRADRKVVTPLDTFGVRDKIYASVETSGQGHARLKAVWTRRDGAGTAKVGEQAMELHSTGLAANDFHIESAEPWPTGVYRVDVYLGNAIFPAATQTFTIR